MSYIYHFGPAGQVGLPTYRASLDTEGFIHCSYIEQVVRVADALYAEAGPMEIAVVAPEKLTSLVVDEDLYDAGEAFPHLYGTIDQGAIIDILPFVRVDGRYQLPDGLPQRKR